MSLNERRPGPRRKGPGRHDQHPATDTEPRSHATVPEASTICIAPVVELADWRQFRAWVAAAEHLNALGYPAAVPPSLAGALRRRGLAVWVAGARRVA